MFRTMGRLSRTQLKAIFAIDDCPIAPTVGNLTHESLGTRQQPQLCPDCALNFLQHADVRLRILTGIWTSASFDQSDLRNDARIRQPHCVERKVKPCMRVLSFWPSLAVLAFFVSQPVAYSQEKAVEPPLTLVFECCKEFRCGNNGNWTIFKGEGITQEAACESATNQALAMLPCTEAELQVRDPQGPLEVCAIIEPGDPTPVSTPGQEPISRAPSAFRATFTLYPRCGEAKDVIFTGATQCEAICKGMKLVRLLACQPNSQLCCYCYRVAPHCPANCCMPCQ